MPSSTRATLGYPLEHSFSSLMGDYLLRLLNACVHGIIDMDTYIQMRKTTLDIERRMKSQFTTRVNNYTIETSQGIESIRFIFTLDSKENIIDYQVERTLNPSTRMNDSVSNQQSTTNVISTSTPERHSRKRVEEMNEENEKSSSLHFSRSCPICLTSSPLHRVVLISCGHSICLLCSNQMKENSRSSLIVCPLCRAKSEVVPLFEDIIECKNEFSKCLDNNETSPKCQIFTEQPAENHQTNPVRPPKSKFRTRIISRFQKLFS